MNVAIYIACCMGVSFIVGLVMGFRIGVVMTLEHTEQKMRVVVIGYAEEIKQLRGQMQERALKAKEPAHNGR